MNKERRSRIEELVGRLEVAKREIYQAKTEEWKSFRRMSQATRRTEAGRKIEAAAQKLDETVYYLGRAISELEDATE